MKFASGLFSVAVAGAVLAVAAPARADFDVPVASPPQTPSEAIDNTPPPPEQSSPDMAPPPGAQDPGAAQDESIAAPAEGGEIEDATFHESLSPYGEWVTVGGVGTVWHPYASAVGPGFRPYYSGGHWVYTEAGWTFVSDYAWGWAPFHYGHWWYDQMYGWVWLPGRHWAPAWVDWRYGGEYVGWAPAPPVGLTFVVTAGWGSPWCFLQTRYITAPRFYTYVVPVERVRTVWGVTRAAPVTTVRAGFYYSAGPPMAHVRAAGVVVRPVAVTSVGRAVPPAGVRTVTPLRPMPMTARSASVAHSQPLPRPTPGHYNQPTPQRSYNQPTPQRSYNQPTPQRSYAPPAPQRSYAPPAPQRSYAPPAPQRSYNQPTPQHSYTPQRTYNQPQRTYNPAAARTQAQPQHSNYRPAAPPQRPQYSAPPPPRRGGGGRRR